jgi:hypothetical protein
MECVSQSWYDIELYRKNGKLPPKTTARRQLAGRICSNTVKILPVFFIGKFCRGGELWSNTFLEKFDEEVEVYL